MKAVRVLLIPFLASLVFFSCSRPVTLESLLQEMADPTSLTRYPDPAYVLKQISSHNPASVDPDSAGWFANSDLSHFIRVDSLQGRREFVMFDAHGPGAIVRWWMTFYKAQDGIIRVYLDGSATPAIEGKPSDLLGGKALAPCPLSASVQAGAPLGEEGRDYDHNLYLPIPFATHCRITYECGMLRLRYEDEGRPVPEGYWWPDVFYNIGYRAYAPGTKVGTFTPEGLERARSLVGETCRRLQERPEPPAEAVAFGKDLAPGDSVVVEIPQRGMAVSRLALRIDAPDVRQAMRSVVLRGTFDGSPTIWAPAGDFFGSGTSLKPHRTRMNAMDSTGLMESDWIMPFRHECRLVFVNLGDQPVRVSGSAGLQAYRWTAGSLLFASSWHEYRHLPTRDSRGDPFDINFVTISGKGIYAGDQIDLYNNTYHWWGEGDEKIYVDGERFPSSFGTGSEDYYGYSFGRQEAFSHPFLSQPEGTGNMDRGITVNMRHRALDAIPFRTGIRSDIEMWHWFRTCINYSLTTYYYVKPGFVTGIRPDEEAVRYPVARPGDSIDCREESRLYTAGDFTRVPKIDAHLHYLTTSLRFLEFAKSLGFCLVSPNVDSGQPIGQQWDIARQVLQKGTGRIAFLGTFGTGDFNTAGFAGRTIARIDTLLAGGASGIKVWKNIGMELKDRNGRFVMADDPAFEPIFSHMEDNGIPVLAHLGEPRNCWLPEDRMTDDGDRRYYLAHPEYYMYLHPEMPSYDDQIAARDRLLERHPRLTLVGAHLGSLEWSVEELGKRFGRFPLFHADLAARMGHLRIQSKADREKVRHFFIRWQDRLIYGSDTDVADEGMRDFDRVADGIRRMWLNDWLYLATGAVTDGVQGLALPATVIDKIYYRNAARVYRLQFRNDRPE